MKGSEKRPGFRKPEEKLTQLKHALSDEGKTADKVLRAFQKLMRQEPQEGAESRKPKGLK